MKTVAENNSRGKRTKARARKQNNPNVQYVRRVPEVHGTAYTEGMSDAYWRGIHDGESTAARMVRRADPRNVRVRSLAVISDEPEEQGLSLPEEKTAYPVPAEPQSTAVARPEQRTEQAAVYEPQPTEIAAAPSQPQAAQIPDTAADTGLIGVRPRQESRNEYIIGMNNNDYSRGAGAPMPAAPDTYSQPIPVSAAVRPEAQSSSEPVDAAERQWRNLFDEGETGRASPAPESPKGKKTGFTLPKRAPKDEKEPKVRRILGIELQPWREISLFRRLIMVLSTVLFAYAVLPLFLGIFNVGIIPIALIAWFFFTAALIWNHIEKCRNPIINLMLGVVAGVVVLGIVGMAFISGKMIGASLKTVPEKKTDVTVVVLGCLVKGDQPSLMLERRLETAAEYLLSNPNAYCVVTGGQGENEDYPEAVVMKNYLVAAGVSEGRIIVEQYSTSTVENIEFAAELIERYNCHETIAIVSDRFHQYRASLAARDAGLESYAMPCETAWYLVAHYWFREMAGIAQIWLQGAE